MTPEPLQTDDQAPGEGQGLSWPTCVGAAAGLVAGVVIALAAAAAAHAWIPGSDAAEVIWEIGAPVLGILGVIVGASMFHRWLNERVWLAVGLALALVALGLLVGVTLGFPWRGGV